ncbi:MAG: UPF0755 protein [Kangiellaceae bacterium]|jgi:UPF0755 protein
MKKVILILLMLLLLVLAAAGSFIWTKIKSIEELRLNTSSATEFEVLKGKNLYQIIDNLASYGKIDRFSFKVWLQFNREFEKIQSGFYELPANARLVDVLSLLSNGEVKQFSVTLIEGQTIVQWIKTLSQAQGVSHNISSKEELYITLGGGDYEFCANIHFSIEGCLLPDTYFYTHGTSSINILKRALIAMHAYLQDVWPTRFADLPINSQYEALILASIIEKETAVESERSEIAGVFVNRLNENMRLQTDPTVIYGIGDSYDGNITRKHLRTPTPYNTYVIKGLPITPIAMPNKASIQATLFPAVTDSLYFVATGNGGHQFSTNLKDHNKAVREYLAQRKRNIVDKNEKGTQ